MVHVIRPDERDAGTAQTPGMRREAGVSAKLSGSTSLWMGVGKNDPGACSAVHHHGESESGVYVARGQPTFLCGPELAERIDLGPGDFLFVPPYAVHVEANLGGEEVEFVVVRSTQEAIVVNLPDHRVPRELLEPPMGV